MPVLGFTVLGRPVPQGSKNAYLKGGKIVLVEAARNFKEFRSEVTAVAASAAAGQGWVKPPIEAPVSVDILFVFMKPKTVRRWFMTVPPDLDKLTRTILDGLTQAENVYADDSQVVNLTAAKIYGDQYATIIQIKIGE